MPGGAKVAGICRAEIYPTFLSLAIASLSFIIDVAYDNRTQPGA